MVWKDDDSISQGVLYSAQGSMPNTEEHRASATLGQNSGLVLNFNSKKQKSDVTFQSHTANKKQSKALPYVLVAPRLLQ